jgi:4-hydroxythreonine-4-phosphate dehydrogenase
VKPTLAISVGCPSGIGPEVSLAAAAKERDAIVVLVGDRGVIERAARTVGVPARRLIAVGGREGLRKLRGDAIGWYEDSASVRLEDAPYGEPSKAAGAAQLEWIDQATALVTSGVADALVTGPVSKHAIAESGPRGRRFRGHTEHLAEKLGAAEVVMAFWSDKLVVSLVTTHLPIAKVSRAITPAGVGSAVFHTTRLAKRLRRGTPKIAVSSLNPHAGEQGLLGHEEIDDIAPGIAIAQKRLVRAGVKAILEGPIGAETAIRKAYAGAYHAVVAMYHDQATIPMKLVGFGDAVNVTLGLPIVRTSVDHGTGYDIAGQGKADARAMQSAMALASLLARRA